MSVTLYRLSQFLLAPGAARQVMRRIGWVPRHGRHLDVGCGPSSWLWREGLKPVGVDCDVRRAAYFGFAAAASAAALPFADGTFDVCWSFGLLHHLSDDDARRTIAELRRVARPGGYLVLFDGVLAARPMERPVASAIRRIDFGRRLRRQEAVEALLDGRARWTVERFAYTATGLEGVLCAARV